MKRRGFIGGAIAEIAVGAAGAHLATRTNAKSLLSGSGKAPATVSGKDIGTTWKIQTS